MNKGKRSALPTGRRSRARHSWALGVLLALAIGVLVPAAVSANQSATLAVWSASPQTAASGTDAQPKEFRTYELDQDAIAALLAQAPRERTAAAESAPLVLALPGPGGVPQRFALQDSPIMQAELARAHPEIRTYSGRGIDDPAATIRADVSPLGFHASIRSPKGNWYIDPSSKTNDDTYVVYYTRDLPEDPDGPFEFKEGDDEEIAAAAVELSTNGGGPSAGDVLRTYRLALITDQSYATYFGGPANVTAAKVALMNRVNQIYEDETSIRLVLINDTDKTNLNTDADAIGANGPCGSAPCYTAAQLAGCAGGTLGRNRIVLGQIIGASNYDIGHLGLGKSGGGVANLGVVGGNSKAGGCTGLPNPEGDYYAVDYVAHEMGHQFAGNHTFNGTQLNCAGNKNGGTAVEPGSGSSIMAYAGICRQDDLQPHSDPYWSQRSFEEISNYVTPVRPPINEVQTASLRDFDGTDSFKVELDGAQSATITNGTNYSAAGIQVALQGVSEIQTVALVGYDGTDSYTLEYKGATTVPIVRGQNNTAAGIQNALQGGNEQQQAVLTGFSATTQSFQIEANGNTSALFGLGGLAVSNANVTAQINALLGSTGVTSAGAGNGGFTLTFGGTLAGTDVAAISIVNCTGACVATVRETAKGGGPLAGWPAGGTVAAGSVTDAGYTLTFGGAHQGTDVDPVSVTNASGVTGAVIETVKGAPGDASAGRASRRSPASAPARSTRPGSRSRSAAPSGSSTSTRSTSST